MDGMHGNSKMGWGRFFAMIATSTAIMFVLMYQLVYAQDHLFFSLNRLLASLAMGCIMALVMLGFMWKMYAGQRTRLAVAGFATLGAIALLAMNRNQTLVDDTAFMRAMIPHHSIAINNSRKATISDPRVRRLADKIIESQVSEIEQMRALIDDIERNGRRGETPLPARDTSITPAMQREIDQAVR